MADVPVHINVDTEAVVEAVMKIVRVGMERVRAEVAEGIARAIEAVGPPRQTWRQRLGLRLPRRP